MDSFEKRFSQFKDPDYISLISPDARIPLYIGTDSEMRYLIEFHGKFTPKKLASTSSIEVSQYRKPKYNTLRFTLINEEVKDIFFKFCEDLVEQTDSLADENQGYLIISNRFMQWKQMFVASHKKKLTETEIMGLIAEILFMKGWMAQKYGLSEALKAWSGQELTHKDFSLGDTWYEVKAISRGKPTVRISSLEQLDSEMPGQLVVFPLEKMSEEFNGVTLNKLVKETVQLFSAPEDVDMFKQKVALQGYEISSYYDSFVFSIGDMRRFCVDESFPRLVRKDVPSSIANCIYDLLLRDLDKYETRE